MEIDGSNKNKRPPPPPIDSGECIFPACPKELASAVMQDVIHGRITSTIKECHLSAKVTCKALFDRLEKFKLHGRFLTEHNQIAEIRDRTGNRQFAEGHTSFSTPGSKNLGKELKHNIYCSKCYCTDPEKFTLRVIGVISVCYEVVNEGGEKVGVTNTQERGGFEGEGDDQNEKVGVTSEAQAREGFEGGGEEEDEKVGVTNDQKDRCRVENEGKAKDVGGIYYRPAVKLLMVYPHSDQCNIKLRWRRNSRLDKEYNGRGWDTVPFPTELLDNTYCNFVDQLKQTDWDTGEHHGELQKYDVLCNFLLNNINKSINQYTQTLLSPSKELKSSMKPIDVTNL